MTLEKALAITALFLASTQWIALAIYLKIRSKKVQND